MNGMIISINFQDICDFIIFSENDRIFKKKQIIIRSEVVRQNKSIFNINIVTFIFKTFIVYFLFPVSYIKIFKKNRDRAAEDHKRS